MSAPPNPSQIPGAANANNNNSAMDVSHSSQVSQASTSAATATMSNVSHTTTAAGAAGKTDEGAAGRTTTTTKTGDGDDHATTAASNRTPTDQAVLEYLKLKGMGSAVLELQEKLKHDGETATATTGAAASSSATAMKEQMEMEDDQARNHRLTLTKSTGGGFGYDRDAAAPIAQWGVPDNNNNNNNNNTENNSNHATMGATEAKAYLDAFCALQLWVLQLPDDLPYNNNTANHPFHPRRPRNLNVIARAQALIRQAEQQQQQSKDGSKPPNQRVSLSTVIDTLANTQQQQLVADSDNNTSTQDGENKDDTNDNSSTTNGGNNKDGSKSSAATTATTTMVDEMMFQLPPSAKPELLAVTFALLVHTYCELLEVGMETTAHVLRDAFKPIYEPMYEEEYQDLYQCITTDDMVKLNTHNSQHMEALGQLKSFLIQISQIQLNQIEWNKKKQQIMQTTATSPEQQQQQQQQIAAITKKLKEYTSTIQLLQQQHAEVSKRASHAFDRMYDVPFLRRARAVRWQLTLSTASYGLLASFLSSNSQVMQSSLLSMSTLLQTKCELHVEQRDPLPFTPACILDDNTDKKPLNEKTMINWAAPLPRSITADAILRDDTTTNKEDGTMDVGGDASSSTSKKKHRIPFPKFHLEEEYETEEEANWDKRVVEFNRAVLIHGFRRLEALERKREFESLQDPTHSGSGSNNGSTTPNPAAAPSIGKNVLADPLKPSILMSTLCANTSSAISSASSSRKRSSNSSSSSSALAELWEEAGIGLTCAKLCPPDGRRVAVGCDDAAVRVWNLAASSRGNGTSETCQVLLGHKNGFPVFDVSWNRDGRSLLSCGGDGSIRLWDTMAQGPFGDVIPRDSLSSSTAGSSSTPNKKTTSTSATSANKPVTNAIAKETLEKATKALTQAKERPDMNVPGLKPETNPYTSGAALAVYRGHAPNTPIWSVEFAPCGYYFCSAGADATARLWTTDRSVPVRIFAGHTSNCVHSVTFHPNCNYVLTGCEDKTVRLWDIQTGRCVRLMNGCPSGIHKVQIDPSGRYAAGADAMGTIHLWDLATGKKVTEFCPKPTTGGSAGDPYPNSGNNLGMVHTMSFSSCGTALATGGDDRCVRIWDIQKTTSSSPIKPVIDIPTNSFATRRTIVMDLHYTKRNLLLSVGKYISAVHLVHPVSD